MEHFRHFIPAEKNLIVFSIKATSIAAASFCGFVNKIAQYSYIYAEYWN